MFGSQRSRKYESLANKEDKPKDGIETIDFIDETRFITGDWAGILTVYRINKKGMRKRGEFNLKIPIIKVLYVGNFNAVAGCADGTVFWVSMKENKIKPLKRMSSMIVGLFIAKFKSESFLIIVESKGSVHATPLNDSDFMKKIETYDCGLQILDVDYNQGLISLAFHKCKFVVVSLLDMIKDKKVLKLENCSLQTKLRFIRLHQKKHAVILTTIEGRAIYLKFRTSSYSATMTYTTVVIFASAKDNHPHKPVVYHDCTAIDVLDNKDYPNKEIFAIANSNKTLTLWDMSLKNKTFDVKDLPENIIQMKFNKDGSLMVFATGYNWGMGIWGVPGIKATPNLHYRILEKSDFSL